MMQISKVQLHAWEPIEVCMLFCEEDGASSSHKEVGGGLGLGSIGGECHLKDAPWDAQFRA